MTQKKEKQDLEKIASQLARVTIRAIPGEEEIALKATATFTTKSYMAGSYKVSVGLSQALLHLDHPGFEAGEGYQATLSKETWSQTWKKADSSNLGGAAEVKIGAKFLGFLGLEFRGNAARDSQKASEQKASAPYPIVSAVPSGWRIGTELGDPRDPDGTLPEGLEHCLSGEYLSGRRNEAGEGPKDRDGAFVLCVLRAKTGGNDPLITATLFGIAGSLKVAIAPADPAVPQDGAPHSRREAMQQEADLRKAFVDICIQRAKAAQQDGAGVEGMVSGEFYLHHHAIHAPRLPPKVPAEIQKKAKSRPNEQNAPTESNP
ncbi:MAG TPA: hypothetical protein VF601_09710 [Beijerinckiaceae bacterium]